MANEIVDTRTGEVLPAALLKEFEEAASHDTQVFDQDQLIIPRITILQDLSPQVKVGNSEHIEGARPGMIFNTVTGEVMTSLVFVPAFFAVRHVAWKPRRNGGGLIEAEVDPEILIEANGWRRENAGKWIGRWTVATKDGEEQVPVEVIKAGEWAGIAIRDDGGLLPVAISFPGSKAKVGKKINSTIDLAELPGKKDFFKPLPYAHTFTLLTGTEPGPEGDFWNFVISQNGWTTNARAYNKAKDLREAIKSGEATVADVQDSDQ